MNYTKAELEKKYTVQDAINAASCVLKAKGVRGMCLNKVRKNVNTKINLEELNTLSQSIVDDSLYFE